MISGTGASLLSGWRVSLRVWNLTWRLILTCGFCISRKFLFLFLDDPVEATLRWIQKRGGKPLYWKSPSLDGFLRLSSDGAATRSGTDSGNYILGQNACGNKTLRQQLIKAYRLIDIG